MHKTANAQGRIFTPEEVAEELRLMLSEGSTIWTRIEKFQQKGKGFEAWVVPVSISGTQPTNLSWYLISAGIADQHSGGAHYGSVRVSGPLLDDEERSAAERLVEVIGAALYGTPTAFNFGSL